MKYMYLEVSIRVEALDPPLLQPVSDLYGDSHILGAVCQEHMILPFVQIIWYCYSGFRHSGYIIGNMNNSATMTITIILTSNVVIIIIINTIIIILRYLRRSIFLQTFLPQSRNLLEALFIYLFIYLFICSFVYLFIYLFIYIYRVAFSGGLFLYISDCNVFVVTAGFKAVLRLASQWSNRKPRR